KLMVSFWTTLCMIIAGAVELWRLYHKHGGELDEELVAGFALVAGYVLVEKVLGWKEERRPKSVEKALESLRVEIGSQKDLLLKVGDVRTLGHAPAGLRHLTDAMTRLNAISIRDIVVRSAEANWYPASQEYRDFLEAKKTFLEKGHRYLIVGNPRGIRQLLE